MEGNIMKKLLFTIIIFIFMAGFVNAQDMITAEITNDPKPGQQLVWHPENNTFKWEFEGEFYPSAIVEKNDPKYEVTIHIVYNSIPVHEIADLVQTQLRKYKDACKVEIKIKNVENYILSITDGTWTGGATTVIYNDGDTASD